MNMTKSETILHQIGEIYATNPQEADRLYNEEYLPLVKKENIKMKKEFDKVF